MEICLKFALQLEGNFVIDGRSFTLPVGMGGNSMWLKLTHLETACLCRDVAVFPDVGRVHRSLA